MWTADIRMKWRCDHRSCDCDLSNRKVSPKNIFGASTDSNPWPLVSAAVLHQLSYEGPYVGSRPIYWIHRTHERQGCSLVLNGETDKILGMVVRSVSCKTHFSNSFPGPLIVYGLPVSCPFNFPNGNLEQQLSHIGVFICYQNIDAKKNKFAHLWYTPLEPF